MQRRLATIRKEPTTGYAHLWLIRAIVSVLGLAFFIPFVVADGVIFPRLLFPYITGKALAFRALVEFGAGLYVLLILREPKYIVRISPLMLTACSFMLWGAVAVFESVDPGKSFWGNVERMDGYLTLLHLFAYFVIVGSVITIERRWTVLCQVSVVGSTLMALYGVFHLITDETASMSRFAGTFGTPTYLSVYLLFGIFLALLLLVEASSSHLSRAVYFCSICLQSFALYLTQTRGALLGLVVGLLVFASFIVWRATEPEHHSARRLSLILLTILSCIIAAFVVARGLPMASKGRAFDRISSISFEETSIKSRLYVWNVVWRGFLERPIFGWGQENFNSVVSTFDNAPKTDEWFDRAHNELLDWLIAGGLPMLLLYILLWYLALGQVLNGTLSILGRAVVLALWAAYFVNNLFVFDNLVSAMYFWLLLAFSDNVSVSAERRVCSGALYRPISGRVVTAIAPMIVVVLFSGMWFLNAPAYFRAQELLAAVSIKSEQAIVNCSRAGILTAC